MAHDKYYLQKFPQVRRWAPALASPQSPPHDDDLPVHRLLTEDDDAILPACHVFLFHETSTPECALLLLQDYVGNLLVTSDALQSQRDNPYINMPVRAKLAAQGMMQSNVVLSPQWLRKVSPLSHHHSYNSYNNNNSKALRSDFERLLRLDFERLIASSGVMVHQGAKEQTVMAVERAFPTW
jgi:hypothetical protein